MTTPGADRVKIGIIPYNRPHLLARCLESLTPQTNPKNLYLFQDAPRHESDEPLMQENIRLFREVVGKGDPEVDRRILLPEKNLGPHLNTVRVFRHLFRNEVAEFAVMSMDDLVFSSRFVEQMGILAECLGGDPDVGSFGCSGEHCRQWTREQVEQEFDTMVPMHHQMACCVTRHSYLRLEPYLEFHEFIVSKHREGEAWRPIMEEFVLRLGLPPVCISIDAYCAGLLYRMGKYRLSTVAHHVKNIGVPAAHKFAQHFDWDLSDRVTTSPRWDKSHERFQSARRQYVKETCPA